MIMMGMENFVSAIIKAIGMRLFWKIRSFAVELL